MSQAAAEQRREIVAEIYRAFAGKDPDVIEDVSNRFFATDVVVREPESLPYGGEYEGLETVKALFSGLTDPSSPVDAARLVVEDLIAAGDRVVGFVSFPWHPPGAEHAVPMQALELFSFRDQQVIEIQVFLWDTAACLESLRKAAAA